MEIMHKGMWTGRRVLYLSVDAIRANPDQPRKYFEPEALRELAESIGRYGILQPLTVRRTEKGYELIAGERRLRAAMLAGLREVPCLLARSSEEESALLALIENLQRRDLHYLEEAAAIDGCGSVQTFFRIVLPMLKPITATITITNVLWVWNDFLLPLIVISDSKKYTLLLSTNTLFGQYSSDWTAILSALILAALPVIGFYAVFQKQILKGIADGAVKG